jgi:hypothetical protein
MRLAHAGRVAAATAVASAVASIAAAEVVQRDVIDVAAPPGLEIRVIDIDNRLGDIRIEGGDRDSVSVVAVKRAADEDTVERLKVTLVPDPAGVLHVATSLLMGEEARPIAAGSVRVDLVLRVPRTTRPRARVWNGRLHARDLDRGAELSANEGRIEVENVAGAIAAHVARGHHDYRDIFGALDAQGISGEMVLSAVRGERVELALHEGSVRGRDVEVRSLSIITTDADVVLRGKALRGAAMHIASYRGHIDVRLETDAALAVRAISRSGPVEVAGGALRGTRTGRGRYIGFVPSEGNPAAVELSSRVGTIRLAVLTP